jgi:glycosyltransferase involved in cell wall biosynthesis
LKSVADPRVLFTGAIYGVGYRELQSHALCYIHATEVGGTHPALVEAMSCGSCVLYLDTPENREVAGDAGLPFDNNPSDLAAKIQSVLDDASLRQRYGRRAADRAQARYRWEDVTTQYERLFQSLLSARSVPPRQP